MSPHKGPVEVVNDEKEIDRLYQQPHDQFVPARNALVARLRAAGRKDDAERIRELTKPSASAWAANQVFWFARPTFDALVEAGERLREAQQGSLRGRSADLADAMMSRERAVNAFVERASQILTEAGMPPTEATRRRLSVNADALAAQGTLPSRPAGGRLSEDLSPPGLSLLTALAAPGDAAASGPAARPTPATQQPVGRHQPEPAGTSTAEARRTEQARQRETARKEARARAEFEAARADSELRRRRQDAERAEREAVQAEGRAEAARAELEGARARLEASERRARDAVAAGETARARSADAARNLREAEAAAQAARKTLESVRRK